MKMRTSSLSCLSLLLLITSQITNAQDYDEFLSTIQLSSNKNSKCEPLSNEMLNICNGIGYNQTYYPNVLKHKSQTEAVQDLLQYQPLIRVGCSPQIKLFLCSLFAPPCIKNYTQSILKPCRELCEQASNQCESLVKSFNYEWPEYLNCAKFPSFYGGEACISDQSTQNQVQSSSFSERPFSPTFFNSQQSQGQQHIDRPKFQCPNQLNIVSSRKSYYLMVNDDQVNDCAMPCDNTFFNQNEILFSRLYVLIWSTICFLSTLFTILTFLIEMPRFKYPERPIIFISGCYMIVALAFVIGSSSLNTNTIVCKLEKNQISELKEFLLQGTEYYPCTVLFMMSYFFIMSASIWWVILTLTWFLAAGLKWGHEAIESIASYFHLAAWSIPAIKMIAILAWKKVDADILSGICYTGINNMSILRGFVLAPLVVYLILGSLFLLAGFVSLFRIRTVMKHEGTRTDKLEKFMVRIGVFSILYMLPAIILICCYFYEQSTYTKWVDAWLRRNSNQFSISDYYMQFIPQSQDGTATITLPNQTQTTVHFTLFMIKYSMMLIVGITSGFWIWSRKTMNSWRRFFSNIFVCCCSSMKSGYKHEAAV